MSDFFKSVQTLQFMNENDPFEAIAIRKLSSFYGNVENKKINNVTSKHFEAITLEWKTVTVEARNYIKNKSLIAEASILLVDNWTKCWKSFFSELREKITTLYFQWKIYSFIDDDGPLISS